jgi:hypothetical protein
MIYQQTVPFNRYYRGQTRERCKNMDIYIYIYIYTLT